ncbi:MAG: AIR synthase related protein [Acidimicrobiia bacterium]|nr:AIR synthase related protein [Acidimicrobiia bacterium]
MPRPPEIHGHTLDAIVDAVRRHTGLTGKQSISSIGVLVDTSDPIRGPGDDGAIIEIGGQNIVACGEALSPPFVQADPYGAGIAAVLANVNDVAAMGGVPLGIVNTLVGPAEVTREVMRGMADAARMYDVPIVGGHLTERPGDASVSAFAIGSADGVLSMANVAPGHTLLFACFLDGHMRSDFPFFSSIDEQADRFAADVRVLATVAASGAAVAAKDVSMAGALGSLAMLLEFRGLGADVDLERMPVPVDTDFVRWLISFPSYAFWVVTEPGTAQRCVDLFGAGDLTCVPVGEIGEGSSLTISVGGDRLEILDFATEAVTGLWA